MVLGGSTDHRGAADIDVFNSKLKRAVRTRNRLLKGIEVHADDVNRTDVVVCESLHVLGHAAACKNPGVNVRIKRLHAPVKHLGKPRVVGNLTAGDAFFLQKLCGSARGENRIPELNEPAGKVGDTGLIRNTDQCLFSHAFISL